VGNPFLSIAKRSLAQADFREAIARYHYKKKRAEEMSVEAIERYCKDNRRPMEAWEGTEEEFKCLLFQYN
jgi:hypothetical protein